LRSERDANDDVEITKFGVPIFLDQLIKTLAIEQSDKPKESSSVLGNAMGCS
jgi:hypothetical protein